MEQSVRQQTSPSEVWSQKLASVRSCASAAAELCDEAQQRAILAAKRINLLFGAGRLRNDAQSLHEAEQQFLRLRALGTALELERARHISKLKQARRHVPADVRRVRAWAPVDTTHVTLQFTSDMDLVHTLTSGLLSSSGQQSGGPEGSCVRDEATGQWRVQGAAPSGNQGRGSDLLHGGPELSYVRDPATGRWLSADRLQIQAPELAGVAEVSWFSGAERGLVQDPTTGRWCHAESV